MSKYVKTKNGIYNLEEKDEKWQKRCQINDEFEEETYGGKTGRILYIPSKKVLKQADTIKELCDEFIHNNRIIRFEGGSEKYFYYLGDGFTFELDEKMIEEGIYGAVWCEFGLKYVAKLNDRGELELL